MARRRGWRSAPPTSTAQFLHAHTHSPLAETEATGRVLQQSHTAEAVSLKMRTDSYVTAVSKDIKERLRLQKEAWQLKATGVKPEAEPAAAAEPQAEA